MGYLTGSREALVLQEAGQPVELARVVVRVRRVAAGSELQPGAGVTLNREPRVPGQQPDPFRGGLRPHAVAVVQLRLVTESVGLELLPGPRGLVPLNDVLAAQR
jgi:hypothetical protein